MLNLIDCFHNPKSVHQRRTIQSLNASYTIMDYGLKKFGHHFCKVYRQIGF